MEKEIERIVRILRLLDERKLRVIYFFVLGMMYRREEQSPSPTRPSS